MNISIAMCTFNGARFIGDQLASIRCQREMPYELVVVDDCSSDDTVREVERFISTSPFPVRLTVNTSRIGYRANFLKAAQMCTGSYICFCDQDDVWLDDKIRSIAEATKTAPALIFHSYNIIDHQGSQIRAEANSGSEFALSPWNFPLGFSIAISRDLQPLLELGKGISDPASPSHHLAHDEWVWILAWALNSIIFLPQSLVNYRQHDANAFGSAEQERELFRHIQERLLRFPNHAAHQATCLEVARTFQSQAFNQFTPACNAVEASQLFYEAAEAYGRRAKVYSSLRLSGRLTSWLEAVQCGLYSPNSRVMFANRAMGRDLLLGVLLAGRLKRFSSKRIDNSLRVFR